MHHSRFLLSWLPHAAAIFFFFVVVVVAASAGAGGVRCTERRCGGTVVPYPFGFSGACPILLRCNTSSSTALLPAHASATASTPYRILSFNASTSTFLAAVDPTCDRTVAEAEAALIVTGGGITNASSSSFAGYGITYRTSLILRGGAACRTRPHTTGSININCTVPADLMTEILRTTQCPNDTALTCVAAAPPSAAAVSGQGQFLRRETVAALGCHDAFTAVVVVYADAQPSLPSLLLGIAELGWWLHGTCNDSAPVAACAANAKCHDVETPSGTPGHQCVCLHGMTGDGFAAGEGCRSAGEGCRAAGEGCRAAASSSASKKNIPLIVAGVLAGVVAITVGLLIRWLHRRRSAAGRYGSAMRLLSEAASSSGVPVYSYHEVARATNDFSHTHRLGTGAYGTVYVGELPSPPTLVAIKRLRYRLHHDDNGEAAQLLNEIKLISSVSHPNLVRLLGCCLDRGEQILIYEYVPNGTLSQHLHGGSPGLSWRARLGIAVETAAAIAYLHGTQPPIFHRDVKSSNILLDGELRPKLADFGLSRAADYRGLDASRSHVSTAPQGTPGYVDPEYHQNFHLSDKSDVYSFGVVLLELITAMKVVDVDRPPNEVNLASLALDRIGKGLVSEIVDPALVRQHDGEEWVAESVRHVSELAFRCLAFQKDVRPCMSEVTAELSRIRAAAPEREPGSDSVSSGPGRMTTGLQIDVTFDNADLAPVKKAASPVSVQDVWVSDRSSPSTNSSIIMPRFL